MVSFPRVERSIPAHCPPEPIVESKGAAPVSAATPMTEDWIHERLNRLGMQPPSGPPVVWRDTCHYMSIERDHLVELNGEVFLVRGNEREGRFGLDDQPKFWVKRALEINTGKMYILKLVIQESFKVSIGSREVLCVRSAEKESRVLDLVRGDARFMQGHTSCDASENPVRIINWIAGTDLLSYLHSLRVRHEDYSHTLLPAILARVANNIAALECLHKAGLCHGDIRNDHLLIERETGCYKWIDFDLEQDSPDFDIWSVGNILHCIVAKGFTTFRDALYAKPELSGSLSQDDASVFFPHRIMNLRKVYPYVPEKLNKILLRFSFGAEGCYDRISQLISDLGECISFMT